jgi:hypothetical protein
MVSFEEIQAAYYMVAATGVLVAAAYYVVNMRATLQTRQAQLFMQIYNRVQEPDFLPSWNEIMQTNFKDYQEFKLKIVNDPSKITSLNKIVAFYEGVGVLVKENLIDIHLVAELMCGVTRKFWEKIEPVIEEYEKEADFRRYTSETKYLYNRLMEYLATHPELQT